MLTQEQKDNVERLIIALRSGEYRQGEGKLCIEEFERGPDDSRVSSGRFTYCCLGVAAKIAGKTEVEMLSYRVTMRGFFLETLGKFLPDEVAQQFGFDRNVQKELAWRNDANHDFGRIADYLDEFVKANS